MIMIIAAKPTASCITYLPEKRKEYINYVGAGLHYVADLSTNTEELVDVRHDGQDVVKASRPISKWTLRYYNEILDEDFDQMLEEAVHWAQSL